MGRRGDWSPNLFYAPQPRIWGTGSSPGSGVKTLPAVRRGQGNRNSRTKQKASVAVSPEPAVPGGSSGLGAEARKRKISHVPDILQYSKR
ncbi:hypothetical protein CapIbe_001883 [Capra ibex]